MWDRCRKKGGRARGVCEGKKRHGARVREPSRFRARFDPRVVDAEARTLAPVVQRQGLVGLPRL